MMGVRCDGHGRRSSNSTQGTYPRRHSRLSMSKVEAMTLWQVLIAGYEVVSTGIRSLPLSRVFQGLVGSRHPCGWFSTGQSEIS